MDNRVDNLEDLTASELEALIQRVFQPRKEDKAIAILVDLPDGVRPDSPSWKKRREMASEWVRHLQSIETRLHLRTNLCLYRNTRAHNADLPLNGWIFSSAPVSSFLDDLSPSDAVPFSQILSEHSILMAVTEFSATAPLKVTARTYGFRAATMGGFNSAMISALRLDYREINRRVDLLKVLLDASESAELRFEVMDGSDYKLHLDLRYRKAHASGGLFLEPGTAGNLPSGETYIVPYEGEKAGQESRSAGQLPVQFDSDIVIYDVKRNRAVSVQGSGESLLLESERLGKEPAYGNIAELGLGVLHDFGVEPCGSVLLDEKLGLHIAFGRSDHFGGQVGPADFSSAESVVHIDRVYVPAVQPRIRVKSVDVFSAAGKRTTLIKDDQYVIEF